MGIDYTNGWDVVIAVGVATLKPQLLPISSSGHMPFFGPEPGSHVSVAGKSVEVAGYFAIAHAELAGGTGSIAQIRYRTSRVGSLPPLTLGGKAFDLRNVNFLLDVTLTFKQSTDPSTHVDDDHYLKLVFGPGVVRSVKVENPPTGTSVAEAEALGSVFADLLVKRLQQAVPDGFTIATLPLSKYKGRFPWMAPIHGLAYAFHENALGFLIASENEPPGPPTLHDGVLASGWGCNAVLVISNRILSEHFLCPMLAAMIQADPSTSGIVPSGTYPMTVSIAKEVWTNIGAFRAATATANDGQISVHLEYDRTSSDFSRSFTTDLTYELKPAGTKVWIQQTSFHDGVHSNLPTWFEFAMALCPPVEIGLQLGDYFDSKSGYAHYGFDYSLWGFIGQSEWPFPAGFELTHVFLPGPIQFGGRIDRGR